MFRFRLQPIPCIIVNVVNGMFSGQRSTVGNGLSGEHRFAQGQPNGYFQTKELDRTTEPIARMNVEWEGWVCWVQLANMWQHCSLTAVQRKTAFVWKSHDGLNLTCFGSKPWRSFPWHKHLPRLAQRNCYTVYSLNLIHKFTWRWF